MKLRRLRKAAKNIKWEYLKSLPLTNVVTNVDGADISQLGDYKWKDIDLSMHVQFFKLYNVRYDQNRSKDDLGPIFVAHLKAQPIKNSIASMRHQSILQPDTQNCHTPLQNIDASQ